jgi:hypothetical protein
VLRNAKNVPIVTPDQVFERANIARLGRLNQRQLVADWLTHFWLDGSHDSADSTILGCVARNEFVF